MEIILKGSFNNIVLYLYYENKNYFIYAESIYSKVSALYELTNFIDKINYKSEHHSWYVYRNRPINNKFSDYNDILSIEFLDGKAAYNSIDLAVIKHKLDNRLRKANQLLNGNNSKI